jgi:signal transduction histidine kinase
MDMELRVLIVAAPSGDSGLILDHLHRAGYHLFSERVDTLAAMDEALGARTWDVIISLSQLPAFGVGPALELVRQRQLDLPFIVVAPSVTVQGVVAAIKAGAHDCIMMDELHRLAASIERGRRDVRTRQAYRSAERSRHTERAQGVAREIQDAERRRIARDLHDVVLQDLVLALQSLQVPTQATAYQAGPGAQQEQVITALRHAVQGLRNAIYNLRLGEDLSLVQSLEGLVALHRQAAPELAIRLAAQDAAIGILPASTVVEVSRIVHEALVNVRRHAAAQHVQITLWSDAQGICVHVVDDGRGFDRETIWGGVGLPAMHERAEALDGQLSIHSARGMGTQVQLRIPRFAVQEFKHDLSALAR